MAGKSRQPIQEPPCGRRKTGTCHTGKTVEKEREGQGRGGRQPPRSPHAQENADAQKMLTKTPTKLLQHPMDQEYEESWGMRISNKPLMTAKVKLVLLVVNSVKLHLTALIQRKAHIKVTKIDQIYNCS